MKNIFFIFFHLFLTICLSMTSLYEFKSNFSVSQISKEEKETIIANTDLTVITTPANSTIECFDVNEDGLIALGHTGITKGDISVYSSDGTFKYGFEFQCYGEFGVEWDKDILNIYFVRGSVLVSVNSSGEIVNVADVEDTAENNSYYRNSIKATKRNVNGIEYEIKNVFMSSYSQLVVKEPSGQEIVLYNANDSQLAQIVIVSIIAIVFTALGIIVVVSQFVKRK